MSASQCSNGVGSDRIPILVRSLSAQFSECVFSMSSGLLSAMAVAQKRATAVVMVVNFMLAVIIGDVNMFNVS